MPACLYVLMKHMAHSMLTKTGDHRISTKLPECDRIRATLSPGLLGTPHRPHSRTDCWMVCGWHQPLVMRKVHICTEKTR